MVEDHCSVAEAHRRTSVRDVHPPKAIMAQNTGKQYAPQQNDNQ